MKHALHFYIQKITKQIVRRLRLVLQFISSFRIFFVHTMKFSPGDPRPPSPSFPGSSLQARGGRVPLHVSPEMSHHLKHTHTDTQPGGCLPAPERSAVHFASAAHARKTNKREVNVWVCVKCGAAAWMCMNVAACANLVCVMKCVMCLHFAAQAHWWLGSLEACLTQLQGTERKVIIS